MLLQRLLWLDERNRAAHRLLRPDDHCLYFGEYRPRSGWRGGPMNDLILDFKRRPEDIALSGRTHALSYFKERAIAQIAQALRAQFAAGAVRRAITFVPLPTSRQPDQPTYCDRLPRALRLAFGRDADIRPLLRQRAGTAADPRRTSLSNLLELTEIDYAQLQEPLRALVVLFDDVLTSGKHLRVAAIRIRELAPRQPLIAVFVARRLPCSAGSARSC
ncbi:MAG TPA: hypothetical protein VMG11_00980 [Steroidobacteraceae bacterium]|nr:hypothetical protein [Steroidobacteraceae bacterium]